MKLKIFVVYDTKAEAYMQPFFMASTGQALRTFEDTVNDTTTTFNKHSADFTLFEIGTFEDDTGSISMYESKTNLGTAIEFLNQDKPQLKGVK